MNGGSTHWTTATFGRGWPTTRAAILGQPSSQVGDQAPSPGGDAGGLANGQDRVQHVIERARAQCEHPGMAAKVGQGGLDLPGWQGANGAQVLSQNQVGLEVRQRLLVQRVQVAVGGEPTVDVLVDLPRVIPAGVQAATTTVFRHEREAGASHSKVTPTSAYTLPAWL